MHLFIPIGSGMEEGGGFEIENDVMHQLVANAMSSKYHIAIKLQLYARMASSFNHRSSNKIEKTICAF